MTQQRAWKYALCGVGIMRTLEGCRREDVHHDSRDVCCKGPQLAIRGKFDRHRYLTLGQLATVMLRINGTPWALLARSDAITEDAAVGSA